MSVLHLFRQTANEWMEYRAMRLGAALAYYAVFSLAPLLLIAISIAGAIFGDEAARGMVERELSGAMGREAAGAIQEMITNARDRETGGIMAVVGVALVLASASGVFAALKDALNTIWGIQVKPNRGFVGIVRDRFLSLAMVLVIGFLLLVSLVLSATVNGFNDWLGSVLPIPGFVWQMVSFLMSFAVVSVLFAMIFKILPDAEIEWRHVWIGAVFTALLFTVGKFGLALYLGRQDAASTYGAAGALVLVLLWVYYSSLILLFGAVFTRVYARERGHRIRPKPSALRMDDAALAKEGIVRTEVVERIADRQSGDPPSSDPRGE